MQIRRGQLPGRSRGSVKPQSPTVEKLAERRTDANLDGPSFGVYLSAVRSEAGSTAAVQAAIASAVADSNSSYRSKQKVPQDATTGRSHGGSCLYSHRNIEHRLVCGSKIHPTVRWTRSAHLPGKRKGLRGTDLVKSADFQGTNFVNLLLAASQALDGNGKPQLVTINSSGFNGNIWDQHRVHSFLNFGP